MRDSTGYLNEDHRYFPEWADLPGMPGPPAEADHNSYLSGGYSEEFGYHVSVDRPPVFAPLDGDPDDSRLWYVQITGLHPGYPECGRPDDRNTLRRRGPREAMEEARSVGDNSGAAPREATRPIRVIRVGERTRSTNSHEGLATRLTSLWARWRDARRRLDH